MLTWISVLLAVAVIAAAAGLSAGIGLAASIVKILLYICLVPVLLLLIAAIVKRLSAAGHSMPQARSSRRL